jgi:hypothetical protein
LKRKLDQTWIAAMQAAQQMHRVRKIAAGIAPRRLEQLVEIRMASAPISRDPRELGFGNADRLLADGPTDRHSTPLRARSRDETALVLWS